MSKKRFLQVSGICALLVPIIAFSCILLTISATPTFNWSTSALSDLGVGPAAHMFNGGLMASGAMLLIFAVGLLVSASGRIWGRIGAVFLLIDAIALSCIGLFTEAAGDIHFFVSVAFFTVFSLSMFLLGADSIRNKSKKFGLLMIAVGVFVALPWVFWWFSSIGLAIPEAISAGVAMIWVAVYGIRLFLNR